MGNKGGKKASEIVLTGSLLILLGSLSMTAYATPATTWANFESTLPVIGVPTTISLGGGSTVDLTVTTGGTQGLTAQDFGTDGVAETGLNYSNLITLKVFDGGGIGSVATTLVFTNFRTGPTHVGGFLFVGDVNGRSSPVTVTSSEPGGVQAWPEVGNSFDLGPTSTWPISWNALSGTFTTDAPVGDDSQGIIVSLGSLSQYQTITIQLEQWLDDGIFFSMGEEVDTGHSSVGDEALCDGAVGLRCANPITGEARFWFALSTRARVRLLVFDAAGRVVADLLDDVYEAGDHSVTWTTEANRRIPTAGIYFARLTADDLIFVRKFVLSR